MKSKNKFFLRDILDWLFCLIPYILGFVFIIFLGTAIFESTRGSSIFKIAFIYFIGGLSLKIMLEGYIESIKNEK